MISKKITNRRRRCHRRRRCRRRSSPPSSFIVILISLMQITNEIVRDRPAVHSSSLMGTIRGALSGDRALSGRPAGQQLEFQREGGKEERTTRQPLMFVSAPRNVHFRLSESRVAVFYCVQPPPPSSSPPPRRHPPRYSRIVDTINTLLPLRYSKMLVAAVSGFRLYERIYSIMHDHHDVF